MKERKKKREVIGRVAKDKRSLLRGGLRGCTKHHHLHHIHGDTFYSCCIHVYVGARGDDSIERLLEKDGEKKNVKNGSK